MGRTHFVKTANPREPVYRDEYIEACVSAKIPMDINLYKVVPSLQKEAAPYKSRIAYTIEKDLLLANAVRWYERLGNMSHSEILNTVHDDLMFTSVSRQVPNSDHLSAIIY